MAIELREASPEVRQHDDVRPSSPRPLALLYFAAVRLPLALRLSTTVTGVRARGRDRSVPHVAGARAGVVAAEVDAREAHSAPLLGGRREGAAT
jgi:hypothetical protein